MVNFDIFTIEKTRIAAAIRPEIIAIRPENIANRPENIANRPETFQMTPKNTGNELGRDPVSVYSNLANWPNISR